MQRQAVSESRYGIATYETKDSMMEKVMVELHDTIREVTIITVDRNEVGDTVFRSVVTDRTRAARREDVAAYRTKTVIKTDTVFVERRDSVLVQSGTKGRARDSPFVSGLKWVFWIVIALIGLGIVLRIRT